MAKDNVSQIFYMYLFYRQESVEENQLVPHWKVSVFWNTQSRASSLMLKNLVTCFREEVFFGN